MGLALVACGKQETTAGKESINETVESVQVSIFANPDETLYYFGEHKGHQGIAGTPVERYLQDAIDNEPELIWHKQMKDLFSEVIHEAKQTRDFSPERILQIENKYDIIVKLASEEYEQHPPNKYFPEGFNLFKRMVAYKKNHLLFLILADV